MGLVASVGEGIGGVSGDLFAVVVVTSVATTLLAPPVLVCLYRQPSPESTLGTDAEAD
jgi:hypothetical protein